MDILSNYNQNLEKFEKTLQSTKHLLAKLDVLSDAVKTLPIEKLREMKADFGLSSSCTKWMQLNEALDMLEDVNITKCDNEMENMANITTNKFIFYAMIDEFKLNDTPKPTILNIKTQRQNGYTGLGFISHIVNETRGLVYILDVMSMPDALILFGSKPQRLLRTPNPGEIFGYLFQNKFLVRASRVQYEGRETIEENQYTALLIDIGCKIRIDIDSTAVHLFEVTEEGKRMPSFAKMAYLIEIPSTVCIQDLLHMRIQYKVLCNDGDYMVANILSEGVSPFEHFNEWNFYMYFIGHILVEMPPIKRNRNRKTVNPKTLPTPSKTKYLNPFTDPELYEITNVPILPLTDKSNPFYFDEVDGNTPNKVKPKFVNFRVTKPMSRNLSHEISEMHEEDMGTTTEELANYHKNRENIIIQNFANFDQQIERYENNMQKIATKSTNEAYGSGAKSTSSKPLDDIDKQLNPFSELEKYTIKNVPVDDKGNQQSCINLRVTKTLKKSNEKNSNQQLDGKHLSMDKKDCVNAVDSMPSIPANQRCQANQPKSSDLMMVDIQIEKEVVNQAPEIESGAPTSIQQIELVHPIGQLQTAQTIQQDVESTSRHKDFVQPFYQPSIGDTFMVLYQKMVSVEEFYAVITDDPTRNGLQVNDFTIFFNMTENVDKLVPYNLNHKPKVNDKVVALYEESFYRAKVIAEIDEHVFQVFYVDYGNCDIVSTMEMFEYDDAWDEYPVYAVHFRLNRVKEINPWDFKAKFSLEQIMVSDCKATVVDITSCEKTHRTTYVVELEDENGLNIADTLIHKNMAHFSKSHNTPSIST